MQGLCVSSLFYVLLPWAKQIDLQEGFLTIVKTCLCNLFVYYLVPLSPVSLISQKYIVASKKPDGPLSRRYGFYVFQNRSFRDCSVWRRSLCFGSHLILCTKQPGPKSWWSLKLSQRITARFPKFWTFNGSKSLAHLVWKLSKYFGLKCNLDSIRTSNMLKIQRFRRCGKIAPLVILCNFHHCWL